MARTSKPQKQTDRGTKVQRQKRHPHTHTHAHVGETQRNNPGKQAYLMALHAGLLRSQPWLTQPCHSQQAAVDVKTTYTPKFTGEKFSYPYKDLITSHRTKYNRSLLAGLP